MVRKLVVVLMVFTSFVGNTPVARAQEGIVITAAITVVAAVCSLIALSNTTLSSPKEAVFNVMAEDAAAFIMSEGKENPSALLSMAINQVKSHEKLRNLNEPFTDLEIAHLILNQTTSVN